MKRRHALPVLAVSFMLAMMVLPLVQTNGVSAENSAGSSSDLKIKIPISTPTPSIPIKVDGPILINTPVPTIPIDVDGPILIKTPVPTIPIDVDGPIQVDTTTPVVIDPDVDIDLGAASINVQTFKCEGIGIIDTVTFGDLVGACPNAENGVGFSISDGGSFVQSGTTGAAGAGAVHFNVPGGVYSIVEQVPAGYESPIVFCDASIYGAGTGFVQQSVLDGNQIFQTLQQSEVLSCSWFNFAPASDPVITLPDGWVLDVDGDDPVIDLPDCVEADEPVVIKLPEGVDLDLGRRTLVIENAAQLFNLDSIAQAAERSDWTIHFSDLNLLDQDEDGSEIIIIPVCDDVPDAEAGTIGIFKTECPLGYDAYAADIYDLALICQSPTGNVGFLLSDGAQAIDQNTTNASGFAGFVGVPAEPVSIVEQVPAGYGEPIVYCITNSPDASEPGATVGQPVLDGNQILVTMPESGEVSCSWFNVPTSVTDAGEGDGEIIIQKTECPTNFDAYSADIYDLALYCNAPQSGVNFLLSDGNSALATDSTDGSGIASFLGVEAIPVSIVEQIPAGFGEPIVYCISNVPGDAGVGDSILQDVLDSNQIFHPMTEGESLSCAWYNVPASSDAGDVTIHKYVCTEVPALSDDPNAALEQGGCETLDGIDFTLTDSAQAAHDGTTGSNGPGTIAWSGIPAGETHIQEDVPSGYGEPVVFCTQFNPSTDQPYSIGQVGTEGGAILIELNEGSSLTCWWINIPSDDSDVTVIKYTCDPGYDLFAFGADPKEDCKHRTNGIGFQLARDGSDTAYATTGDGQPKGEAFFGGLVEGQYNLQENTPAGIEQVFVLECAGISEDLIQNYPLALSSSIDFELEAGDHVVCRWYNVPADYDYGTITITKYACDTATFVDSSLCQIYESGIEFELDAEQGGDWFAIDTDFTNAAGQLTWSGLAEGTYQIDEVDGTWCYAASDRTDSEGNLLVAPGEVTHVDVYNCGVRNDVKDPVKLPNTGVGPAATESTGAYAPVAPAGQGAIGSTWNGVYEEWLLARLAVAERPASITIAAIGVKAETEVLETVAGAMQDPTGADKIAWYKDSARLGVAGNIVLAGHLNWWGVPEAVFYRLADVQVGDEIVVTGDRGATYTYRVTWVEPIDSGTQELSEIVGQTDSPSLTLITCGGEWNAKALEYNQRTVVRAELVVEF